MPTHCSPGGRTPPVPREAPAPTPLAVDSTADIPVKRAREVDEEGEKRSGKMSPRITKACTAVSRGPIGTMRRSSRAAAFAVPQGESFPTCASGSVDSLFQVKMKCMPTDPPSEHCHRCTNGQYECVFLESRRGRVRRKPSDIVAKLRAMQATIDSVLLQSSGGPIAVKPLVDVGQPSVSATKKMVLVGSQTTLPIA